MQKDILIAQLFAFGIVSMHLGTSSIRDDPVAFLILGLCVSTAFLLCSQILEPKEKTSGSEVFPALTITIFSLVSILAMTAKYVLASYSTGFPVGWDTPAYANEVRLALREGPFELVSYKNGHSFLYQLILYVSCAATNIREPIQLISFSPVPIFLMTLLTAYITVRDLSNEKLLSGFSLFALSLSLSGYRLLADLHANLLGLFFNYLGIYVYFTAKSKYRRQLATLVFCLAYLSHLYTAVFFFAGTLTAVFLEVLMVRKESLQSSPSRSITGLCKTYSLGLLFSTIFYAIEFRDFISTEIANITGTHVSGFGKSIIYYFGEYISLYWGFSLLPICFLGLFVSYFMLDKSNSTEQQEFRVNSWNKYLVIQFSLMTNVCIITLLGLIYTPLRLFVWRTFIVSPSYLFIAIGLDRLYRYLSKNSKKALRRKILFAVFLAMTGIPALLSNLEESDYHFTVFGDANRLNNYLNEVSNFASYCKTNNYSRNEPIIIVASPESYYPYGIDFFINTFRSYVGIEPLMYVGSVQYLFIGSLTPGIEREISDKSRQICLQSFNRINVLAESNETPLILCFDTLSAEPFGKEVVPGVRMSLLSTLHLDEYHTDNWEIRSDQKAIMNHADEKIMIEGLTDSWGYFYISSSFRNPVNISKYNAIFLEGSFSSYQKNLWLRLVDKNGKSEVFSFYVSTKDKWETVIVPLSSRKHSALDFENIQEIWVYGEVEGIPSSTVRLSLSKTIRLSFWDSTT